MPTYDYECKQCGPGFELKKSFHESSDACCPKCQGEARRLFSVVPILFKGPGFYVTDSKNGTSKSSSLSGEAKKPDGEKESSPAKEKETAET
jgi:putative FmdB family regulatory protein